MDKHENLMKQLNNWADMYEKAQDSGVFEAAPKPHLPSPQTSQDSFFGLQQTNPTSDVNGVDSEYWSDVYHRIRDNRGNMAPDVTQPDDDVLDGDLMQETLKLAGEDVQEAHTPEKLEKAKDHPAVKHASAQNPTNPWTTGKDQRRKVTPNWTEGEELEELDKLKRSLYDLEVKLSGPDGLREDKDNSEVISKLDKLKKDIDELSDALAPQSWQDRES